MSQRLEHTFTSIPKNMKNHSTNNTETTRQFFKENNNIIVTQADKANAGILMEKEVNINKVYKLLSEKTSSSNAYQKMNEKILDKQVMSKRDKALALHNESHIANMYILIKTHKEGQPPRPIANTRKSPGYLAANTITKILTKVRDESKYNVFN